MKHFRTVGIIGLGSFGAFVASCIAQKRDCTIYGYDQKTAQAPPHVKMVDLATVASADVVILAIPLEAYSQVLLELRAHIKPETLVVDVCSVKVYAEQYFVEYLPDHQNVLLTHPLFGPQTAADTAKGHTLIVTRQNGDKAAVAVRFCEQEFGLRVHTMSSEEHDRHMAHIHVLTFFIARGLSNLHLDAEIFATPSYKMITDLVEFDHTHTDALFRTIQNGNPFAADTRQQVVDSFSRLAEDLQEQSKASHETK